MAGRFAAAQVIVIEGGQVVVDQRIGMQHLDGCAQIFNTRWKIAAVGCTGMDHAGRFHGQDRPQTLASGKGAVTHGSMDR